MRCIPEGLSVHTSLAPQNTPKTGPDRPQEGSKPGPDSLQEGSKASPAGLNDRPLRCIPEGLS
eukprot:4360257-Karenia_brevis.AAC.1